MRCIQDLKSRGFKVIFYPFLLMTAAGLPWRGRITYSPDVSSARDGGGRRLSRLGDDVATSRPTRST